MIPLTGEPKNALRYRHASGSAPTGPQRGDLLAFLDTLTDKQLILDMRYDNPWRKLISHSASW